MYMYMQLRQLLRNGMVSYLTVLCPWYILEDIVGMSLLLCIIIKQIVYRLVFQFIITAKNND